MISPSLEESRLVLGPELAGTLMTPDEFDAVEEYDQNWVFDRFQRCLTVFFEPAARPAERVIAEGEKYHSPCLPGFDLPLAKILAVADAWK